MFQTQPARTNLGFAGFSASPRSARLISAFRSKRRGRIIVALHVARIEVLETEIRKAEPAHALVILAGELDASNVGQLYEQLAELAREGTRHIALNLAELEFIDSTGLSVIIAAHKRAEMLGGELIIFSPPQSIRRLFTVTGIDTYLNIRPKNPTGPATDRDGVQDQSPATTDDEPELA
jgi:anti-sigma B factor antagonist